MLIAPWLIMVLSAHLPLSTLGFCLAWACMLCQSLWALLFIYLVVIGKLFPWSYPLSLALKIFLSPLQIDSWAFRRETLYRHPILWAIVAMADLMVLLWSASSRWCHWCTLYFFLGLMGLGNVIVRIQGVLVIGKLHRDPFTDFSTCSGTSE